MQFSITQTKLQNAISLVQKGISTRSTMPVLAGIYVEARDERITVQSTDLELSIQYTTSALVEEEGKAVLPGKIFSDISKSLPDAAVHVKTAGFETVITCESSSFSLKGLDPQDWPGFPEVKEDQSISIPFDVFSSMAKKVSRVVSRDESRPILTGVLIAAEQGFLKMVATDSYRLAVSQVPFEGNQEPFAAVVSGSFISDLASLPKSGSDISFALSSNQIVVSYNGTTFVNRRIEGTYPDYRRLIPSSYETRCSVDRDQLVSSVKRAALLYSSGAQVRLSIEPNTQTLQISSVAAEIGSAQETLSVEVEGPEVEIGFNSFYITDGLNGFDQGTVYLDVQSSLKPGVFRTEDDGFLYLVMPVRL